MTLTSVVHDSTKSNLPFTQRILAVTVTCSVLLVAVMFVTGRLQFVSILVAHISTITVARSTTYNSTMFSGLHRKLLHSHATQVHPNRIWGDKCSNSDIIINQSPTDPLPSGIPA